ncbi:MAG: tetratricopeptide repeat protein [Planctomycetia bacterium]|nr:tetratricopeptide repeat protein [Planctomycetia bacterium]
MLANAIDTVRKAAAAHYNIQNPYSDKRALDEAIASLQKSIEVNPYNPSVYFDLGSAYSQNSILDAAANALEETIRIDPNFAKAHYGLSIIYERKGMKEEAQREFLVYKKLTGECRK